ncbi:MAG: OsmC family protein [Nitrospirota bacterium]|nr:MAG: OsmC family protein [Nitrospirota bacterium]
MSDEKEVKELDGRLGDYKTKVKTDTRGILVWEKDLIFTGRTSTGYAIEFDAKVEWGCMPTESLMLSLAGCMAIDSVSFLQKMKCEFDEFKLEITGERNETPPQYFRSMHMKLMMKGQGFSDKKVQRAIDLSQDKYCSVYHSLRPDMKVTVSYVINDGEEVTAK